MMLERIGDEAQPVLIVDGFAPNATALRDAALGCTFGTGGEHYPGIRAPLPAQYLTTMLPRIAQAMGRSFGRFRRLHVIDASFSIVTTAPGALSPRQRLPHVDAYGIERIALVHYLSNDPHGTAFYRHRETGYETVDETRAPRYFAAVDRELDRDEPPPGYVAGDTAAYACTARIDARFDRALIYRSFCLHSGAIPPDAILSPDPACGRLTVTGFLAME